MTCITVDLIRKKSEHHSGILFELEELSLAQQDLERIELLGRVCPNLKILTLQTNCISRLENLSRLKDLRYLNVAINQISRCENLQGCESLERLDLTLNRIGVAELPTLATLQANVQLRRLYLLGNPCTTWPEHRQYVIAVLPQLEHLDGKDVLRSEQICAKQVLPNLIRYIQLQQQDTVHQDASRDAEQHGTGHDFATATATSSSNRKMQSRAVASTMTTQVPNAGGPGKPKQRNQGKWQFRLDDSARECTLTLSIGKYTSLDNIDIDVQTSSIQILLQGQIFCLDLPVDVMTSATRAEHSTTTGDLTIRMPKAQSVLKHAQRKPAVVLKATSAPRCNAGLSHKTVRYDEADIHTREQIPDIVH